MFSTANPSTSTHRLLYRGALSLPDSHLLLDGLTFSAPPGVSLLQNPLALALESMRGRPSLRFMGVVKMADLWVDKEGDVCMEIHPHATLTKVYFENTFCLEPIVGHSSECGVRVALGDSTASTSTIAPSPDLTEIIIYARPSSSSTPTVQLLVARITPAPPQPRLRLPRPDDPTPRKPPLLLGADRSGKGKHSREPDVLGANKKAKIVASLGSDARIGRKDPPRKGNKIFKMPDMPLRSGCGQSGPVGEAGGGADVFGPNGLVRDKRKGKGKGKEAPGLNEEDANTDIGEVEMDNKLLLKQSTVHALSFHGITKQHDEFKELFGFVYRGAMFALRKKLKGIALDTRTVDRIVEAHVGMYV